MRKKAAAVAGRPVRILSCYEAGLDGHWLHRWLTGQGIINHEIDPSSIEVNRRARRAKTDRVDLEKLMRAFLAHLRGEPSGLQHRPRAEMSPSMIVMLKMSKPRTL
jgi:transposase